MVTILMDHMHRNQSAVKEFNTVILQTVLMLRNQSEVSKLITAIIPMAHMFRKILDISYKKR